MSGWGSFTQLWCEYGFTLQQDFCCSGMLLWILTVFAPNKLIFFLAFVSNTSYFCTSTCSFSPTLLLSRAILPYWFCEVQWSERSTGTGKGVGSIPKKIQVFIGLSVWNNLSAGLHHWPRWYILFCNWCPCCQMSQGSRQNLQDSPSFYWCRGRCPKTASLHDRLLYSISLLWDVKILSEMWHYWKSQS